MPHVNIGNCPACGQPLKAKEHAPRERMHITCHCGWHGPVQPDDSLVRHAEDLRLQGAGHRHRKTSWERFLKWCRAWWKK